MSARSLLPLLLTFAMAWSAAPAEAKLREVGRMPGSLLSDGNRFLAAAASAEGGPARVFDAKTGRLSTVQIPDGCRTTGLGGGKLLLTACQADRDRYTGAATGRTLDVMTGEVRELPAIAHNPNISMGESGRYVALGRRWAQLTMSGYHYSVPAYVDLVTGRYVRDPAKGDPRIVARLDEPRLLQRLCAPMRRPSVPSYDSPGNDTGELVMAGRVAAGINYEDAAELPDAELLLQRCGRTPRAVADCAQESCSHVMLDDRVLAWVEADLVRLRPLKTGRTRTIARGQGWQLALLRHRLYGTRGGKLRRLR